MVAEKAFTFSLQVDPLKAYFHEKANVLTEKPIAAVPKDVLLLTDIPFSENLSCSTKEVNAFTKKPIFSVPKLVSTNRQIYLFLETSLRFFTKK